MSVLDDEGIRTQFLRAWQESQPESTAAHEEGGFVLRDTGGSLVIERWPRGVQNEIVVPPHPDGKRGGHTIVATFHTHPNPEPEYQQEPSLTDIRAVRDDPDLNHSDYEGEYVIALEWIYRIRKNGHVETVAPTSQALKSN